MTPWCRMVKRSREMKRQSPSTQSNPGHERRKTNNEWCRALPSGTLASTGLENHLFSKHVKLVFGHIPTAPLRLQLAPRRVQLRLAARQSACQGAYPGTKASKVAAVRQQIVQARQEAMSALPRQCRKFRSWPLPGANDPPRPPRPSKPLLGRSYSRDFLTSRTAGVRASPRSRPRCLRHLCAVPPSGRDARNRGSRAGFSEPTYY